MEYKRSEMLFKDEYKWSAPQSQDSPEHRRGPDFVKINKSEGYEVLYFINDFAKRYFGDAIDLVTYQKIERMIKDSPVRQSHLEKENWIRALWSKY